MNAFELKEAVEVARRWRERGLLPALTPSRPELGTRGARPSGGGRYPSLLPERARERYLRWKAKRGKSAWAKKYGKLQVKVIFAEAAGRLGISESAARARYYRKQL